MPIQHAVLALLAEGRSYGYELKGKLEATVGPQWGLNIGHVYQVLDRLRRDELVTTSVVTQSRRPDRTMYRITPAGRAELDIWLDEPVVRSAGYRDDFFLKLLAASRRDLTAVQSLIGRQRHQHLGELKSLTGLQEQVMHDPFIALLVEAAVLGVETQLRWLDTVESQAEVLLEHAQAGADSVVPAPATTDSARPGRGRSA